MKTNWLLGCLAVLMCGVLLYAPSVHAQQDRSGLRSDITIKVDKPSAGMTVTHTVTTLGRNAKLPRRMKFPLPVHKTENLKAAYMDGGTHIPFTKDNRTIRILNGEFQHALLELDLVRRNKKRKFKVSYRTQEGVSVTGDNLTIALPLLDGDIARKWSATVSVPDSLPEINYHPPVTRTGRSDGKRRFTFDSGDIDRNFLGLSFARTGVHTFEMETELHNTSPLVRTKSITLPLDTHAQSVFVESITPRPDSAKVDRDGNIIAEYTIWPWQKVVVSATVIAKVQQLRYDPGHARPVAKAPEILHAYTEGTKYWPVEGAVKTRASNIVEADAHAWQKTRQLHDFVREEIVFREKDKARVSAEQVLEARTGNASGIADLLVALLRSQDIPARVVEGIVYPSTGLVQQQDAHAWVEAYVAGVGWITLDPVWTRMFDSFGYSSSDRIAIRALSGDTRFRNVTWGPPARIHVEPGGTLPDPGPAADRIMAEAVRYVVLPGVVFDRSTLISRSGYVTDGVRSERVFKGSFPPRARVANNQWRIAMPTPFRMSWQVNEQRPVVTEATVRWWPTAVPISVIGLAGVIQFYRYRSRQYIRKRLGRDIHEA